MGQLFLQGLRRNLVGSVTVFDINSRRLQFASRFGARETVDSRSGKIAETLRKQFDVVIETAATGT